MITFMLSEVVPVLNATLFGPNAIIQSISVHSNHIGDQCLFVALKGDRYDAHFFISHAICQGASALLVSDYYFIPGISQLVVKDTRFALAQLAFWIRKKVSSKIIAITGSSGKTSVKEMTAGILCHCGSVVATHENYNNEIGVSLTLLQLTYEIDFAVIEVGGNIFGEIEKSSNLILPDVVLINNIFVSHLLGFGSLKGVAQAKGEILSGLSIHGRCVLNVDSNAWFLWNQFLFSKFVWTFSVENQFMSDFFATNIVCNKDFMQFILHTPYGSSPVLLSMLGKHNISNALAASALALSVGASLSEVVYGLEQIRPLSGRLFPIYLSNDKLLLDDTYNANVGSVLAAVDFLNNMEGYRVIVLGDMAELGNYTDIKYHQKIGKAITMTNIDQVLTIGYLSYFISCVHRYGEHFCSKDMLLSRLIEIISRYKIITVLVKGSRTSLMDQIVLELKDYFV